MPTQPISADTLGTYLPAMLIPAVDLTQPVGSRNIKLNASSFLGVLTTTFAIQAVTTDSAPTGGNTRGNYAVDLQQLSQRTAATQVASGANTFTAGYANTASVQYAVAIGSTNSVSGTASVALGSNNTVSGNYSFAAGESNSITGGNSVAIGNGHTCSNTAAVALGNSNTVSGNPSFAVGQLCGAGGTYSVALGGQSADRATYGSLSYGAGVFAVQADAQIKWNVLRVATTNATATRMLSDGGATATASNAVILPLNSSYRLKGWIVANNAGTAAKEWQFDALIRQGASAATTTLIGAPTATSTYGDAGLSTCAVTLSADTALGALNITVAGVAATTIHWVCRLETVEAV